ncbi:hypothetical protein NQ318_018300, partial [Aromia moschata]
FHSNLIKFFSFSVVALVYIRYRQVKELCEKNELKPVTKKLNKICLYLGFIACYGVVMVASFQETNVLVVHLMGAAMCFGLGTIYEVLQVSISVLLYPTFGDKLVIIFRGICAVICLITHGLTFAFGVAAWFQFTGTDITKWERKDGGYDLHLISVISEWILAIVTQLFLVSFAGEFRLVQFSEPTMSPREIA